MFLFLDFCFLYCVDWCLIIGMVCLGGTVVYCCTLFTSFVGVCCLCVFLDTLLICR